MLRTRVMVPSLVLALATSAPAFGVDDVTVSLSTGYDYSSGEYGDTEFTNITFVPVTAQLELDAWTFKVSGSWLRIDGPGSLIADGEFISGPARVASGVGDTNVSVSYLLYPFIENGPFVELISKVKIPTADETEGLGSGATDFTGMVSIFQKVDDDITLFLDFGYRARGSSDLYELENGFIGGVGGSFKFTEQVSAGVLYNFRQAATPTGEDPMDLSPFVTFKPGEDWVINGYGTFGLTDASPETGFGVTVKRKFSY